MQCGDYLDRPRAMGVECSFSGSLTSTFLGQETNLQSYTPIFVHHHLDTLQYVRSFLSGYETGYG